METVSTLDSPSLPTPEPASLMLLGGAAVCAGIARLRARRAQLRLRHLDVVDDELRGQ